MESNYHHLPFSPNTISTLKKPPLLPITVVSTGLSTGLGRRCCSVRSTISSSGQQAASTFSYKKFIHFALEETRKHTYLSPSPIQENFSHLVAIDGKTELQMLSYEAPKIRLLHTLCIEQSDGLQLLPWRGKITSESLRFFSPMVIWTKFSPIESKQSALSCAFKEYLKAWLELMDQETEEMRGLQILCNLEAQHRYLTWRAEKDPGHHVLTRLIGKTRAKETIRNFLFNGVDELGSKTFLDYFPEYECEDRTVNKKCSVIGKSFESRPWDNRGEFIGDKFG